MKQEKRGCRSLVAVSVILVFSIFLITGCGGTGIDAPANAPTTPFLEGSRGVEIKFLEGAPPEEVTDSGTFDFQAIVSLRNEGEYDLKRDDIKIDLLGILASDFGANPDELNDKRPDDDPMPRRRDAEGNIIEATEVFVTFPNEDQFFDYERSVTGNTVFLFRADVCYKYQTKALSQICVLSDLVNVDADTVCDPIETKTVFSSSSPLQVNSFRQTVAGQNKIQFSFDITHSGNGDVFKEGDASSPAADCPRDPRERRQKENRVKVTVDSGLPNLRCVGLDGNTVGFVTMNQGRRTVTCLQELDSDRQDFETNVDITLDFNYRDDVDEEVLVKHLVDSS
ncbi:hypothetical protein CL615_01620 [archaeon]|jgi:hypothetical protein|nr:hypothetical protein [archaeon]|tara:strand:+ start:2314 stop:3330 length:1017 start_codon:yes stop_codon:yes gene_type:complete